MTQGTQTAHARTDAGRRADLERRVLDWMRQGALAPADDARFDALARELFTWQLDHCDAYRRICASQGVRTPDIPHWKDIPLVPTGTFKEARLAGFPESRTVRVFRTSGTSTETRGALWLDTLELYEASLLATFRAFLCPDLAPGQRMPFAVLAPSAEAAPDSSLSCMFSVAVRELGTPESRFFIRPDPRRSAAWDPDACIAWLAERSDAVLLAGTAFAFVHLLDRLDETRGRLALPPGSRIMETGGFKGRSRELSRAELHGALSERLGVAADHIVNQYGMSELGSQFYEPSLRESRPSEHKQIPPWVRTRALDPETLGDVPEGEPGVLAHYDLANTGSVLAVLTSDLGSVHGTRLRLHGRLPDAEARGCSRAADLLLGG